MEEPMKIVTTAVALSLLTGVAMAKDRMAATNANDDRAGAPSSAFTVTNYYKQDIYDKNNNKVGKIDDVLIGKDGRIESLIVGVGGFLGVGEKDVSVPFRSVNMTKKDNKWYLTMDANKDRLKAAPGLKYDSNATTWVSDNSSRDNNRNAANNNNGNNRPQ
jgi:sporulation protein YlmC with PRC-barrel domain